jgi:hypothetical protein
MRCFHYAHQIHAYTRTVYNVYLSVSVYDSSRETLGDFRLNLLWILCPLRLPVVHTFNFLQSIMLKWRTKKLVRCERYYYYFGRTIMRGNKFSKNAQRWDGSFVQCKTTWRLYEPIKEILL